MYSNYLSSINILLWFQIRHYSSAMLLYWHVRVVVVPSCVHDSWILLKPWLNSMVSWSIDALFCHSGLQPRFDLVSRHRLHTLVLVSIFDKNNSLGLNWIDLFVHKIMRRVTWNAKFLEHVRAVSDCIIPYFLAIQLLQSSWARHNNKIIWFRAQNFSFSLDKENTEWKLRDLLILYNRDWLLFLHWFLPCWDFQLNFNKFMWNALN